MVARTGSRSFFALPPLAVKPKSEQVHITLAQKYRHPLLARKTNGAVSDSPRKDPTHSDDSSDGGDIPFENPSPRDVEPMAPSRHRPSARLNGKVPPAAVSGTQGLRQTTEVLLALERENRMWKEWDQEYASKVFANFTSIREVQAVSHSRPRNATYANL